MNIYDIKLGETLYVVGGSLIGREVTVLEVLPDGAPTLAGTQSPPVVVVQYSKSKDARLAVSPWHLTRDRVRA